ncbi:CPT1A-like protein, partial [Mya arenaria]
MAEAHSAVAFSFQVTHEGVDVNVNHDALKAVWDSGVHSWKKRLGKAKNKIKAGTYPGSPSSWLFVTVTVLSLRLAEVDPSFGLVGLLQRHIPGLNSETTGLYMGCLIYSTLLWLGIILFLKYTLKLLLMYHGWMYEGRGKISIQTKAWLLLVRMFGGRKPMLNSYQASLPKLVLPSVKDTINRYLLSIKPIMDDEKFNHLSKLAVDFEKGLGKKLQRYLLVKSWWATNYVTDWWEEYVYLRGRSPIMVNSNYYGVDAVLVHPTKIPAARAANVTYVMLQYRRDLDREELNPTIPLCSAQYERQFNTTRIPGIEGDRLMHLKDSKHVAVYHKGRFFKVYIHFKGRHLMPNELEKSFQKILDDESLPVDGEEHIPALTGGDRVPWAKARTEFFSKGKNKASLDAIEKAAFFISFDDEAQDFIMGDQKSFDGFAGAMLHGNGYNRWFDKSFTLVVLPNGR